MIVIHADGLEIGMEHDRAYKLEPFLPENRRECGGFLGLNRHVCKPAPGAGAGREVKPAPEEVPETPMAVCNLQECFRIGAQRGQLSGMAQQAILMGERHYLGWLEGCGVVGVKTAQGLAIPVPAFQDREPRESGLL